MIKFFTIIFIALFTLCSFSMMAQNIGIGTTNPAPSAILHIKSNNKGLLIPQVNLLNAIFPAPGPAKGLLVWNNFSFFEEGIGFYYNAGSESTPNWLKIAETSSLANAGEFKRIAGVIHNTSNIPTDDFVFGSTSFESIPGPDDDNRFAFDKSKGAFRAGGATTNEWDVSNVGNHSIGLGFNVKASGNNSTAMGYTTLANGNNSTSMGYNSKAFGEGSTAMGGETLAAGNTSTAMGKGTTAFGNNSTAMGHETYATGINSTVMGLNTKAHSFAETCFGVYSEEYTPQSTDMIIGTDRLFVIGNGTGLNTRSNALTVLKNGNIGIGTSTPHASAKMHIESNNSGILMPKVNLNTVSFPAPGPANGLLVWNTNSTYSDGIGFYYNAGTTTFPNWLKITASNTIDNVIQSIEFKRIGNIVQNTTDILNDDFLFGSTSLNNIPGFDDDKRFFFDKSKAAFRVGQTSSDQWDEDNIGFLSIGMGYDAIASGFHSISMGMATTASSAASIAIGNGTKALGESSTAMGIYTIAEGKYSTTFGYGSIASGELSYTSGFFTEAPSYVETSIGLFSETYIPVGTNFFEPSDRLFVIGNGTDFDARSNAVTVLKNGNVGFGISNPSSKVEIMSDAPNTSGLKLTQLTSSSPTTMGKPLGVDASGNVVALNSSNAPNAFAIFTLSNDQLNGTVCKFNSTFFEEDPSNLITLNTTTGVVSLASGYIYKVTAVASMKNQVTNIGYSIFDSNTSTRIGTKAATFASTDQGPNVNSMPSVAFIKASTVRAIDLRRTGGATGDWRWYQGDSANSECSFTIEIIGTI